MKQTKPLKPILRAAMLLLLCALPLTASAYDFMVDGIAYNRNSDGTSVTVTYTEYNSTNNYSGLTTANIPSTVTYDGTSFSVTTIGVYAFACCSLTNVTIGNSVDSIGFGAFASCHMTSLNIGNSVTTIGEFAFNGSDLTSVTIPNSVKSICYAAFLGCPLTIVTIGNSVTSISNTAFRNCRSLTSVTLAGNGAWTLTQNMPFDYMTTLNISKGITALPAFNVAPTVINCYAETPPTCVANTFSSYDGELHVPALALVAYFTADYWQNFGNLTNDITENVTLGQSEAALTLWDELALTATVTPAGSAVNWSTSNPSVATVSDVGKVTAIAVGECNITATLADNPAVFASCHITVSYPEISLSLSDETIEMNVSDELALTCNIVPDNTGLIPMWASSDKSVATVDANGVVTAVGEGECDISATVLDQTVTCHVLVTGNVIITLDQHELTVDINHMGTIVPTCTPIATDLLVTSSDPSVVFARITTQNGTPKVQIAGMKQGTATVTVSSVDGKAIPDSCVVNVIRRVGDLNADGYINVTDITVLIDIIMGNVDEPDDTEMPYCDLNADGVINVIDITALIDIIMNS